MRRVLLYLLLVSLCALLGGMAAAQQKVPNSHKIPAGSPDCTLVDGNLVANCGFETGSFSSWSLSGDPTFTFVSSDCAHSGTFGACLGPVNGLGFMAQQLATTADQTYTLTYWLRNAGRPSHFQVYWNGDLIFDEVDSPDFPYTQFTIDGLVATGDTTELKFGFFNVPDFYYLDDIAVLAQSSPK